jgi:SAM-dependent methyltransferase
MQSDFFSLILSSFKKEALKKIIFSRPASSEISKISGRLCSHRGRKILALEYSLPGNTVSQKNLKEDELEAVLLPLICEYKQANLLTTLGDGEYKVSKSGKEIILGGDALKKKLENEAPNFERAIEALDSRKNYILSGSEKFLITLGISDKTGRVHDKKQGKFRQINRFLEHIEEIYTKLPYDGEILIYDLCCGKSYLSFAVYYYLTEIKKRPLRMLCIDLKRDVIAWCEGVAMELNYSGMQFVCDDISNTPRDTAPDMVISLHACDIATDIVINHAIALKAKIILSTPCCHKYLNDKIKAEELKFVTEYPQLRNKLCEAITDAIRLARIEAAGYRVSALELTDPENTPKNTLLRAVLRDGVSESELLEKRQKYENILYFVLGENKERYLKEI